MLKVAFLSLEFSAATFSGNGVYARSQVRSLSQQQCEVLVLSGKPAAYNAAQQTEGAAALIEVGLPVWGCLDHQCAWAELAAQLSSEDVMQRVAAFSPSAILGVDWSSLPAYKAIAKGLIQRRLPVPPFVYMNYRVYVRTCPLEERSFMLQMESDAANTAAAVVALSRSDADYIETHLMSSQTQRNKVTVLLPALRADMAALPLQSALPQHIAPLTKAPVPPKGLKPYLTCCVRLSPEKEPHRFVELVEQLGKQGKLDELGITPLMCAAASTPYAAALVARLQAAADKAVILTSFLGPQQLALVYAETRLNCHPCLYDAYGMTIVEAASQGAPSVINCGGAVGASDLLQAPEEVIELDLAMPMVDLAHQVAAVWQNEAQLAAVSQAAAVKARSWTEAANAAALLHLLHSAVDMSNMKHSRLGNKQLL